VVVGLGKVIVVEDELEVVSVRWRMLVLLWVILAPERSRGRQLGSCCRYGVGSSTLCGLPSMTWDSLTACASRLDEGVTSCTAGKRLYCFFFLLVFGGDSDFSSSKGRGDNEINCISSSSAPDFTSPDVLVASLRSPSPKSNLLIAPSTAAGLVAPPGRFGLCDGDGSWV
jgi:hypothetical protein